MQSTFCAPGAPAEVPNARSIVPAINRLSGALRSRGVPVYWVLHANSQIDGESDWKLFFAYWWAFALGLLQAQWTYTGFDASAHMAEETEDPRRHAPWGVVLSVAVSGIAGYVLIASSQ